MPLQASSSNAETNSRLDTVIKLLAAMYSKELNNNDAIIKLDKMQLSHEQIADAVGVTAHNVSQVLYANKKAREKKKAKVEPSKPDGKADPVVEVQPS